MRSATTQEPGYRPPDAGGDARSAARFPARAVRQAAVSSWWRADQ